MSILKPFLYCVTYSKYDYVRNKQPTVLVFFLSQSNDAHRKTKSIPKHIDHKCISERSCLPASP